MASVLKRKRGPLEVVESSKRAKSVPNSQDIVPILDEFNFNWDAAFEPIKTNGDLAATNGVRNISSSIRPASPDAEDYESFLRKHQDAKAEQMETQENAPQSNIPIWKISEPIGGRIIDVDPVFTADEKFIILAHQKTILLYSTSNSLLNRTINLSVDQSQEPLAQIIAYNLSKTEQNFLWVACSNGSIYKLDWTSGEGWEHPWKVSPSGITHMAVASMESDGRMLDVVITTEGQEESWRISAHELSYLRNSTTTQSRVIYTSTKPIQIMKTTDEGDVIVAASEERVLIGALRSKNFGTIDKIRYEFRIFESTDFISSLDIRVSKRSLAIGQKATKLDRISLVDVVVGDLKGAIFVHNDLLGNLIRSQNASADGVPATDLMPRKLHWHRKAVHSVKWSLDGNYVVSGGSETVLVLWQLDTGQQQYLPHLSAAIQNVVVSPVGTSYAIHLCNNSTMVVSTSELVPTANISGLQARVIETSPSHTSRIWRVKTEGKARPFIPRTPAVINPAHPSRLLLAVGESQKINPRSTSLNSAPFLQTFDIASNYNVSRQALARNNVTNKNVAPDAYDLSEAVVSHIQISHDGAWLVTVDEWLPPKHDIEFLGHSGINLEDEQRRRREVFLKFWQWNQADETWVLVSRVDGPHMLAVENYGSGRVLALASDPSSLTFSTIGEDGIVQIWRPKMRKRDGVIVRGKDGEPLVNWSSHRKISLGAGELEDEALLSGHHVPAHASLAFSEDGSALAVAISGYEDGLIHIIDPFTGTIRSSCPVMYRGDVIGMAVLAQYLIIVSDDVRVYDLVLNELKYGINIGDVKSMLSLSQKTEMVHLAVDRVSSTFAIALPSRENWNIQERKTVGSLSMAYSEIAVFDPQLPTPLYTKRLPSLVTALLPAISSPGFVILDAAAEIASISPKASQTLTSIARPMVDLRLDIRSEEEPPLNDIEITEIEDHKDLETEDERNDAENTVAHDLDDDGPRVVSQHQLAGVLDIGPSFALPPIEEMFYHVADLFSVKPVAKIAS